MTLDFIRIDCGFTEDEVSLSFTDECCDIDDEISESLLTCDDDEELYETEDTLACRILVGVVLTDGLELLGVKDDWKLRDGGVSRALESGLALKRGRFNCATGDERPLRISGGLKGERDRGGGLGFLRAVLGRGLGELEPGNFF